MLHHGTIRKYTAALLALFNDLEVQYNLKDDSTITKNIPLTYSSKEKSREFDKYTTEQLLAGNYNVLPRASLSLVTAVKSEQRTTNKNVKINTYKTEDSFEYMFNSVPYEFTFQLDIMCRGMNEACMVIEQLAPKFNPTINIDVWDAINLHEPTRVPVKLLDIGIEGEQYEELSSNIVTIGVGISLVGNLYPPIKSFERIKDFKIFMNESDGELFDRKSILGWDVNSEGVLENGEVTTVPDTVTYPPVIIDVVPTGVVGLGDSELTVIYEDKDNKFTEMTFQWDIVTGDAVILGNDDKATLTVSTAGSIEVQVTVTDPYGNYTTANKVYAV